MSSDPGISTLALQYEPKRTYVFVSGNEHCFLPGGLESLLKRGRADSATIDTASSISSGGSASDNPFDFLKQPEPAATTTAEPAKPKKASLQGFLQKVKQTTTNTLERGMHSLALRNATGPDQYRIKATNIEVQGKTEWISEPQDANVRLKGLLFGGAIVVPSNMTQVTLQLCCKAGGTQLAKEHVLGSITVNLQSQTVALPSPVLVNAYLTLHVHADSKFTPLCGPAWSLTDPDVKSYSSNRFHLPLDQSYRLLGCTAKERAVESTIVLPTALAVTQTVATALQTSLSHALAIQHEIRSERCDAPTSMQVTVQLTHPVTVYWQRPNSMFPVNLAIVDNTVTFYPPKISINILPTVWQAAGKKMPPTGYFLGSLQIFTSHGMGTVSLDQKHEGSIAVPLVSTASSGSVETYTITSLTLTETGTADQGPAAVSPALGVVSLMGLPQNVAFVQPSLDYVPVPPTPDQQRRAAQLGTLGSFVTADYIDQHLQERTADAAVWKQRAEAYRAALLEPTALPEAHKDKTPRAFRPSSSRMEDLLSAVPFNVHAVSWSLNEEEKTGSSVFCNTTCGAPADHARHFGSIFPSKPSAGLGPSPVGAVSGGLRRLEAKRSELGALVSNLQTTLTAAVANFYLQHPQATHVVGEELMQHRWNLCQAVQALHHVTYRCAVRRASCFSQALGIALTTYLTSLSNLYQQQWPELWKQHGYLVSFEGLLSAAGKELGMIEDASVGIGMLANVQVLLVPSVDTPSADAVPVMGSPYLKYLRFVPSGTHPETKYTVEIGVVKSYLDQRIPQTLHNAPVRLYPLLFEVGVDIRQWGAHTGANVMSAVETRARDFQSQSSQHEDSSEIDDDEADAGGQQDDDVLVQLNSEAYQKLNAYAHAVSPANSTASASAQQTHPMLETLYQHIVSSSGKINHDIVDEAASLAQQLGGGGVVFCKSGKDRTAMHVTYKQAQFSTRYQQKSGSSKTDNTLQDAALMRTRGTRLPICEKNVGQAKYAFNSLQVQFMPEALKPPMNTLAGFLKGGKVFTGGGIES